MSELERLTELELVPVVELPAWSFSDRPLPEGPSRDHREAWHRFWLDCLADAGITGLQPIEPGSMHVAVREFTDLNQLGDGLRRLVEPDSLTNADGPGALPGGLAVVASGRILAEPNCCGDLKDWSEWHSAANYRETAWRILWIGHPWLSVRAEGEELILSTPHESAEPVAAWVLDRGIIAPALEVALSELEAFAQRIALALLASDGNGADAVRVSRELAGLPAPGTDEAM